MELEMRKEKKTLTRKQQMVPGVLYGKTIKSIAVKVGAKELKKAYREFGKSMTFKAKLEGKAHQVYIKDIQNDPLDRNKILHFDMIKVSASDKMTANIPVHEIGKSDVEKKGFIVQLLTPTLEAEYQVGKGVASIEIDVKSLKPGNTICVGDIIPPQGITLLDDPGKMVINVTEPSHKTEIKETGEAAGKEEGIAIEGEGGKTVSD